MKVVLGFQNFPYYARSRAISPLAVSKRTKLVSRAQRTYGEGKGTVEVAAELEEKYSIVETFSEMEREAIEEVVADRFVEEIDEFTTMQKFTKRVRPSRQLPTIETKFRQALMGRKFDGIIPGVPTTASLRGVTHIRRKAYAKRPPRPSFVNTGLYMKSFRAWVTE